MEQAHQVIKQQSQIIIDNLTNKWKNEINNNNEKMTYHFHMLIFSNIDLGKLLVYHGNVLVL